MHLRRSIVLSADRALSAIPLSNKRAHCRHRDIHKPIPPCVHIYQHCPVGIVLASRNATYVVFMVFHSATYVQWRLFPHIRTPQVATMVRRHISKYSRNARIYQIADNGCVITRNRVRNHRAFHYDSSIFCTCIHMFLIYNEKFSQPTIDTTP